MTPAGLRKAVPRTTWMVLALVAGLGAAATVQEPADGESSLMLASDGRYAMGTALEATLAVRDAAEGRAALEALFAIAERLDALLSLYRNESDLVRLNSAAGPVPVAPELVEILEAAVAACVLTGGAFDVTVGPLVALWVDAGRRNAPPSAETLAAARQRVGCRKVRVRGGGAAELLAGASVDLGGIGKGFALDRMRAELRRAGIDSALLSFGRSSVWAVGAPPGEEGWRLLVQGPGEGFAGLVTLRDQAFSVSGSLGQWSEIGGVRYGHVIDPRSGAALSRRRQAAVVAANAARAEALSTALVVLGEREGLVLVRELADAEAMWLDEQGRRLMSDGWQRVTRFVAFAPDGAGGPQ